MWQASILLMNFRVHVKTELFLIYCFLIFSLTQRLLCLRSPKSLQTPFVFGGLGGKVALVFHLESKKLHFTLVSLI